MNKLSREEVYKLIDGERDYQDERWNANTTSSGGRHENPEEWIMYMEDYLAEAKHLLSRNNRDINPKAMAIIRKVTAMGVAAMEQIGAPEREQKGG